MLVIQDRMSKKKKSVSTRFKFLGNYSSKLSKYPITTLIVIGGLTIFFLISASKIKFDYNYLNMEPIGLKSIKLQHLLEDKFDSYHFSEQVENGKFFFDYKIVSGSNPKGNAIKLLEIMDYPERITTRANEIAVGLKEKNPLNEGLFTL